MHVLYIYTLQVVSKPTSVSTNWFFRSPSIVTGTPITYKLYCSISATWGALSKAAHELNEVLTFVENIIPLWHIVKSSSQTQWGTDICQEYHSLAFTDFKAYKVINIEYNDEKVKTECQKQFRVLENGMHLSVTSGCSKGFCQLCSVCVCATACEIGNPTIRYNNASVPMMTSSSQRWCSQKSDSKVLSTNLPPTRTSPSSFSAWQAAFASLTCWRDLIWSFVRPNKSNPPV